MVNNESEVLARLRDPKSYLEKFTKIKGKKAGTLIPFLLNEAQKHFFNVLRKETRVMVLKARQLGFCLHEDTKILMADLTWLKIKDVKVGDSVVAVDETSTGPKKKRKMRTAVVEKTFSFRADTIKITFSDGGELIATPEHKLMSKKWECSTDVIWRKISDMKVGTSVRRIMNVWGEPNYSDGWFSGMIDGEGSVSKSTRSGFQLVIAQAAGNVWDRLVKYAKENNISYRVETDNRKAGDSSKFGNKAVYKIVINKMDELFAILGKTAPSRMTRRWWEGKALPNNGWVQVVKIEKAGKNKVVDLQTSCSTYVAEGIVSHNSSGVTGFFYHNTITTPGVTTALIGYNSDLTAELLDKVKTLYKSTPPELRPTIQYNSKYEISFPKLDSKILVLPSSDNVGRGYTIHNCLAEGTRIIMADNSTKAIEDITYGDKIINGNGGVSPAIGIRKIEYIGKICRIKSYGSEDLLATEEHKVLTRDGWKAAGEIKRGDYLSHPYYQVRGRRKIIKIEECIKDGYETRSLGVAGKEIPVTRELGLFVGWYLAEGSSGNGRITLSVHKKEVDEILGVIECIRPYVGNVSVAYKGGDDKGAIISLYGVEFSETIGNLFGRGARDKNLPPLVWECGYDFCFGLLRGLIDGDGYIGNILRTQITTISEKLAYGVKRLFISLRIGLAAVYKTDSFRYDKECQDRYDIILGGKGNYKARRKLNYELPKYDNGRARWCDEFAKNRNQGGGYWRRGKTHYWAKVSDCSLEDYSGSVYDVLLEKEPHSFLTTSGVVHNCLVTELSSWDKAEDKMMQLEASVPINGRLVIESTPRGMGNLFHRMWMADNDYKKLEYGWWWGYTAEEIAIIERRMNNPQMFAQEYGLDFLASGRPAIPAELIKEQAKNIVKVGQEFVDKDGVKQIGAVWKDLRVYCPPKPNHYYVFGVDTSEGVEGGDYSAVVVIDRGTGEEVAFFRGLVAPDVLGEKLDVWGRWYNNALMTVEVNNHGLTTLTILKQKIYPNLYFRPAKFETLASGSSDKMGWKTTRMTKLLMIDDLIQAMRERSLTIHSKELLDEMTIMIHNDSGDVVAMSGYHDDCFFATCVCFQGFKVMFHGALTQIDYTEHLPTNFSY